MYLPRIDETGAYELKAPFNKLLNTHTVYTCRSIRSVNDYLALGDHVYEKFYEPLDIAPEVYQTDLKANVKIVSLQAGTGEWLYVPASFILGVPNQNGVKYVPIVVGVSLGAVPDTFNLEALIRQLKELTVNSLGLVPEVKAVLTGHPKYLDYEEHERLEQIRLDQVTSVNSDKLLIESQRNEINTLLSKVAELERWIKARL